MKRVSNLSSRLRKTKNISGGPRIKTQLMSLSWKGILTSSRAKKERRGKTCLFEWLKKSTARKTMNSVERTMRKGWKNTEEFQKSLKTSIPQPNSKKQWILSVKRKSLLLAQSLQRPKVFLLGKLFRQVTKVKLKNKTQKKRKKKAIWLEYLSSPKLIHKMWK